MNIKNIDVKFATKINSNIMKILIKYAILGDLFSQIRVDIALCLTAG